MPYKDDRVEKFDREHPEHKYLSDLTTKFLIQNGYRGAIVETTEDMTEEEIIMALFAGYLREGYPEDEADKLARNFYKSTKKGTVS
ncbi:MAG: hypothetical protein GXO99_07595 [Nitrospirae bacterium]|nr:hypothetical protein [Nitrospirota bacterium]